MEHSTQPLDLDRVVTDRLATDDLPAAAAAETDFLAGRTAGWVDDAGGDPAVRSRALVLAGRTEEAAAELASLVDRPAWSAQTVAAAAWSASRVSCPELLHRLRQEVGSLPEGFVEHEGIPLGTRASLEGLVATAEGHLDDAVSAHSCAVDRGDHRAPLWGSLARLELARVLLSRSCTAADAASVESDRSAARRHLVSARTFFVSSAHAHLGAVASDLLELVDPSAHGSGPASPAEGPERPSAAAPTLGFLTGTRATGWLAGFGVQPPVRLAHRKGLPALAHLVANRHRQVPAVELDAVVRGASPGGEVDGELLDLLAELGALHDSAAPTPDDVSDRVRELLFDDRVRSRTTKLVRRTVATVAESHPVLAAHLEASVTTGYTCRYEAPPLVRWVL